MSRRNVAWLLAVVLWAVAPGLLVLPPAAAADPIVENVVSFADVPESSQFAQEISWLASNGISTGWDAGGGARQYRPLESIARDAMAAFLYRHAGSPAFAAPAVSPFADVPPGAAFYKEITWLASKRISTGWSVGSGRVEYRPLSPISRDAMAAFLYRYAASPDFTAPVVSPFIDVPAGGGFYREITWLAGSGISTGWDVGGGAREYRPLSGIARDAMAAFLFRFAAQKAPANPADPAAGTVTVAPNVEILQPTQLDAAQVSAGTVTLPSETAKDIKPNDVIVAGVTPGTPDGLLARVVQVVRDPGGNTLIKTKPATLPEAVMSTAGLLEVTGTPVWSEFVPAAGVVVDPPASPLFPQPGVAGLSAPVRPLANVSADFFSRSFAWKKTFNADAESPNLVGTGSTTLETSAKASATATMTLETGFLKLKEASVVLTPAVSATHKLTVSGSLKGNISANLGELNSGFTFMAGPVPVVVTTQFKVSANLTAEGSADISLASSQTVSSNYGFKYRGGAFDLVNTKPSSSGVQNTVRASASLSAKASLDFDATVKLYGIAGITFGSGPYASAAIKVTATTQGASWSCPVELGVQARLGVKAGIEIMGFNLGEWTDTTTAGWSLSIADPCIDTAVVAPDPGPVATPAPTPTPAPEPTGTPTAGAMQLVALTPGGTPGMGMPTTPVVSKDGRYVAFTSASPDLVPANDTNSAEDVFVRDMVTGTTRLVSATPSGAAGNYGSSQPAISADGRYVAFTSGASDLVLGDTNGQTDVFVRDTLSGTTQLISATPSGVAGNGQSSEPSISRGGLYVAFTSGASNLITGDSNNAGDVFVRDMTAGSTALVSALSNGAPANRGSSSPSISADGRHVAFSSNASNLSAADTNGTTDVFVRDLDGRSTRLVSVAADGSPADDFSHSPRISADGRFVAFGSFASNLVDGAPAEGKGTNDIVVRDMTDQTTRLVSVPPAGSSGGDWSHSPSISSDGRFVSFISTGLDMVTGATREAEDVYVRDMRAGTTRLVTATASGGSVDEWHVQQSLSGDGRYAVFAVFGRDLLPNNVPTGEGVYRAELG